MNDLPDETFNHSFPESDARTRGSLQMRMTVLVLAVSIPLIVAIAVFLTMQAQKGLRDAANRTLRTANASITETLNLWLDYNSRALKTLVSSPDIISMNSLWQKPLLKEMAANYPYMTLVSTTDVNGVNKGRSDERPVASYKDRFWFKNALSGALITYETQIEATDQQPEIVVSMPIFDGNGQVVGVGMFTAELNQIFSLVGNVQLGQGGSAFIVDPSNILVAHSDPQVPLLASMAEDPAVKALRAGQSGIIQSKNNQGAPVQAYITRLANGWGVVVQQTEASLFEPIRRFQQMAFTALMIGATLLFVLSWTSIRQALLPVKELTQVATAVSRGDLSRHAVVASRDELGLLAHTFNQMTDQLGELIKNLEGRVAERTQALARRAMEFQVTAEVAREAAAIRDPDKLLQDVANLIPERFGYDHAGIFLIEKSETAGAATELSAGYAVLRAASSEGGRRMLQRGHKLHIGRQGIVGHVAAAGQPRIALDVGSDAVFFNNLDLPLTRSEIALPLKVQEQVIGVLDVQSNQAEAFSDEDVSILQILADQLALAIENTRLLADSQHALRELEILYGRQIRQGWDKRLGNQPLRYHYDRTGITQDRSREQNEQAADEPYQLSLPIALRGQYIGALHLRRDKSQIEWTETERELIQKTLGQLALALENARLYEDAQRMAWREQQINLIASSMRNSVNLETILQNTVRELGKSLGASRAFIQIGGEEDRNKIVSTHEKSPQTSAAPPKTKPELRGSNGHGPSLAKGEGEGGKR